MLILSCSSNEIILDMTDLEHTIYVQPIVNG